MKYDKLELSCKIENAVIHLMRVSFGRISWVIPEHQHSENSYELHYIVSGKGTVMIGGVKNEVGPNTFYVTGPLVSHEQRPDQTDPMVEYCINLRTESTSEIAKESLIGHFVRNKNWIGQDTLGVGAAMQMIYREFGSRRNGYQIAITGMLQYLLVLLARLYNQTEIKQMETKPPIQIMTHFCMIEDMFLFEYRDITLESLAGRLGMSIRQAERLLQKNYGCTFQQMKVRARMSAAAADLQLPEKSIVEIAEKVGYTSTEHFCRAFKRYYGIGVKEYRETGR